MICPLRRPHALIELLRGCFFPRRSIPGAGRESRRRLRDDHRRDAALLPHQAGVVLHSVPPDPSACAEDHRPADEGQAPEGGAEGAAGGGACRGRGQRGETSLQVTGKYLL